MKLSKDHEKFLKLVASECKKHKVELVLSDTLTVTVNGGECSGFFQETSHPKLSVAIGKPAEAWIEILAHEYSHMQQWLEHSPLWTEQRIHNIECSDLVDLWINGQIELSPTQLEDYIQRIIAVEKDCEERTVRLITELKLPIDPVQYTRKSNAYLFFYHGVKKHRKWSKPGNGPYSRPEVIKLMPDNFNQNYKLPCPVLLDALEFCFKD